MLKQVQHDRHKNKKEHIKMAPMEIEYGRPITIGDEEFYAHNDGVVVRYKFTQLRYLRMNRDLAKGTLSLPGGSQTHKIAKHPIEKKLIAGFRVKHVKPEAASTNSQ